MKFEGIMNYIQ